MKTTVELSDPLLREVKQFAAQQGIPMREVFERGLRAVLEGPLHKNRPYRLNLRPFGGEGMVDDRDWPAIKEMIREPKST